MRTDSRAYLPWDGTFLAGVEVRLGFLDRLRVLLRGRLEVNVRAVREVTEAGEARALDTILGQGAFAVVVVPRVLPRLRASGWSRRRRPLRPGSRER